MDENKNNHAELERSGDNSSIRLESLRAQMSELEGKMDDLYMRPRMPYSSTGTGGDLLILNADRVPEWFTPVP